MTLKTEVSVMWRMSADREFQTDGPATENARPQNLVKVALSVEKYLLFGWNRSLRTALIVLNEENHNLSF